MIAKSKKAQPSRRIIVTMDVDSHLASTLELAVALAQAKNGALHGLFIEDVDLLNVAGLPFSQEINLLCGRPRDLDDRRLQRSLSRAGSKFQQTLERLANDISIDWSFSSVRGRKLALELGAEEGADILVIARPINRRLPVDTSAHQILLALDHSPLALPALEVMLNRATQNNIEVIVFQESGDLTATIQPDLRDLVDRYPSATISSRSWAKLEALLAANPASLDCIVASRKLKDIHLHDILSKAGCPIVLVS